MVFIGGLLQIEDIPEDIILSVSLPLSLRVNVPQLRGLTSSVFDSLAVPDITSSVEGERLTDSVVGETISLRNVTIEPLLPNSSTLEEQEKVFIT